MLSLTGQLLSYDTTSYILYYMSFILDIISYNKFCASHYMSFILDIISYNKVCACHCRFCHLTFSAGHIGREDISPVIIIVVIVAIVVIIVLVVLATIIIYRCGGFSRLDSNTCCTPIVHYRALITSRTHILI